MLRHIAEEAFIQGRKNLEVIVDTAIAYFQHCNITVLFMHGFSTKGQIEMILR